MNKMKINETEQKICILNEMNINTTIPLIN